MQADHFSVARKCTPGREPARLEGQQRVGGGRAEPRYVGVRPRSTSRLGKSFRYRCRVRGCPPSGPLFKGRQLGPDGRVLQADEPREKGL